MLDLFSHTQSMLTNWKCMCTINILYAYMGLQINGSHNILQEVRGACILTLYNGTCNMMQSSSTVGCSRTVLSLAG